MYIYIYKLNNFRNEINGNKFEIKVRMDLLYFITENGKYTDWHERA